MQLDHVVHVRVAMAASDAIGPLLHAAVVQLDHGMARVTGEVMVMPGCARAVARACAVLQRIDESGIDQHAECPVDRRKPELGACFRHVGVEFLGSGIGMDVTERVEHRDALVGRANADVAKQRAGIDVCRTRHWPQRTIALDT